MKLRTKIPLSIITFIVIFGFIVIIIGNTVLKDIIKHQIYNQLESTAKARAFHIETYLNIEKNLVLNLSESVVIEKLLEINKKNKNYNDRLKDVITRLKNTKKINEDIYEIFITDTKGVIVAANIEERIGLDRSDALYFINGKKGVYVKDPHYSRYNKNQQSLAVSAPIYQNTTNILLGVVIIRIKLDLLNKITTDITGLGITGEIFLLNKDFYMISPSRFIKDTLLKQKVDTPGSRECWEISDEEDEIERKEVDVYEDYRGKIVIGTHYKIEGMDWCLMSEINRKEAFAPIFKLTIITIFFFASISVISLIVSVSISKTIINPITKMHRGSEEIIKGNLNYKIGIKQKDEIGQLSKAFDEMTLNLKTSKEKIEKYSEHLEVLVEQRTNELHIANKELEAFAYSASHDLRSPLRHIYGFSELLEKRISNTIDEKSLKQLHNITDAAKHMGKLIDDLLTFSRIGRSEMNKTVFDFEHIIKKIQQEMEPEIKGRKVIWKIGQFPKVYGDPSLLQQVLINLVSNAVKFTSKRKEARIEIGSQSTEKEYIFYVQDNGVGFNMKYKEKLFNVFQRLHTKEEFEGTGIGLANVHRVISRHGGRVWAESTLGEGAAFYFSLPKK